MMLWKIELRNDDGTVFIANLCPPTCDQVYQFTVPIRCGAWEIIGYQFRPIMAPARPMPGDSIAAADPDDDLQPDATGEYDE